MAENLHAFQKSDDDVVHGRNIAVKVLAEFFIPKELHRIHLSHRVTGRCKQVVGHLGEAFRHSTLNRLEEVVHLTIILLFQRITEDGQCSAKNIEAADRVFVFRAFFASTENLVEKFLLFVDVNLEVN